MGTLYLVRHGQASFGAADYDQLSDLGQRQSQRLGEYFAGKGLQFEAVLTGTLKRHAQTWAGIAKGADYTHTPLQWAGLDESNSEAVIQAIHPTPLEKPDTPDLLGTTPETTIELNFRIRNSSVTEFTFNPKRSMLVTYNTLPHLDTPDYTDWITFA